jgi:hypothetical protein
MSSSSVDSVEAMFMVDAYTGGTFTRVNLAVSVSFLIIIIQLTLR